MSFPELSIMFLRIRPSSYLQNDDEPLGVTKPHIVSSSRGETCYEFWEAYDRPATGERFRVRRERVSN
ncbi:MAG TPA: hypothetical protein VG941_03005 [Candidatus Paceibacterota bacterium]|nr:hypothetical protein [Candidatus Paceibacterota bacterium]